MVALTPEQQRELLEAHPETFTPEAGAWGRGGSTRVDLAAADEEIVAPRPRGSASVRKSGKR